jgi:hypothetical protein
MDHTLNYLIDQGIAREYDPRSDSGRSANDLLERVRRELAWRDARDPEFAEISGTAETDYQSECRPLRLQLYELDRDVPTGEEVLVYAVVPPSALIDSFDLTTILHSAEKASASPVFTNRVHRDELAYRYEQYKAGLEVLRSQTHSPASAAEFRNQFGAVAFHLANAVISSEQVGRLTIEEIVELRTSMDDARRRFVSEHLVSATHLIEDNPWDRALVDELERFVQGPLRADLFRFQDESKSRFEKLYGTFPGQLIDITRAAVIGSGLGLASTATGLTATIIPGVSPWQMLLISALGGVAHQAREVVQSITDAVLDHRKAQRSSIAYLAAFSSDADRQTP